MSGANIVYMILLVLLTVTLLSGCACPPGYAGDGYVCAPPVSVPFR